LNTPEFTEILYYNPAAQSIFVRKVSRETAQLFFQNCALPTQEYNM